MSVDLLGFMLVQAHKTVQDVVACSSIIRTALVIREIVLHGADRKLLLEAIDLVQEEDDAGLDKPSGVADAVEKSQSLLHAIYCLVFE